MDVLGDNGSANVSAAAVSTENMTGSAAAAGRASASSLPLPTWRLVIALALPVLGQQGLQFFVTLSDRYLAGHIQDVPDLPALQAAQTTAHYLSWFITCYSVFVTVGSTALVARFIGAGEREQAIAVTHQSLLLAALFAAAGTIAAVAGGIPLMVESLRQTGAAGQYAVSYLTPLFLLLVFQMVEAAGIACLVGAGDTRTGLWVLGGVALINVPLAWGFCRGLAGLPRLGFVGIAVGTALSHTLGCMAVLIVLARGRFGLKLSWHQFRPRFDLMRRLLRVSVPAGFDSMSVVVGQFWFLSIVNRLGKEAGAAHGIALVWEALGYLSGAAFGTAAMTLVGQNLGAGRPDQAARAGWRAFGLAACVMSVMGATFFTFAPEMFQLFCPLEEQREIIHAGIPVLRLVAFTMPFLAATIVFTSALRGAGDTRVPVLFTWIGFFAVRIPLAYSLTQAVVTIGPLGEWRGISFGLEWPGLELGLLGAWWAMFADLIIRGMFFFYRFAQGTWTKQKV
jgi:MATE family, multidrug efflux pump